MFDGSAITQLPVDLNLSSHSIDYSVNWSSIFYTIYMYLSIAWLSWCVRMLLSLLICATFARSPNDYSYALWLGFRCQQVYCRNSPRCQLQLASNLGSYHPYVPDTTNPALFFLALRSRGETPSYHLSAAGPSRTISILGAGHAVPYDHPTVAFAFVEDFVVGNHGYLQHWKVVWKRKALLKRPGTCYAWTRKQNSR